MARRSNGRGSVLPLGESGDRWLVRLSYGRAGEKRVRASKVIRGTKREAERALTALLARQDNGVPSPLTRQPLGELLADHFRLWSSGSAPQTIARNRQLVRLYVPHWLAARRAAELTPRDLQRWIEELGDRGLAANTIRGTHAIVRAALSGAVAREEISRNVARLVTVPAGAHREMRALSPEEARAFIAEAEGERLNALWLVLLTCGLRPSEALGLRWDDLDGTTLRVRRSLVRYGRSATLGPTKTGRQRSLPIGASVARALATHRARQAAEKLGAGALYNDRGMIFAGPCGEPLRLENLVGRHFKPLVARTALRLTGKPSAPPRYGIGELTVKEYRVALATYREAAAEALRATDLKRLRLYDLRHSAASLMLANGEHPKIVADRLGHANITLTLNTYSHVTSTMQEQAAERLDMLLGEERRA